MLGRRLRGLGRRDMMEMVRALPMSVYELLNDWFETAALKGVIGAGGITNIRQGPRASGTALVLLHHLMGAGAFRAIRTTRGGVGSIATALAAAAKRHGAEIRSNAEVIKIVVKNDRAAGVALASGEEIYGAQRCLIRRCAPHFLRLDWAGIPGDEPLCARCRTSSIAAYALK